MTWQGYFPYAAPCSAPLPPLRPAAPAATVASAPVDAGVLRR
jgi:hypothetical protein